MVCAMHVVFWWTGGAYFCSWDEVPTSLHRNQTLVSREHSPLKGKLADSKAMVLGAFRASK